VSRLLREIGVCLQACLLLGGPQELEIEVAECDMQVVSVNRAAYAMRY
jgi:hypothetical protein